MVLRWTLFVRWITPHVMDSFLFDWTTVVGLDVWIEEVPEMSEVTDSRHGSH